MAPETKSASGNLNLEKCGQDKPASNNRRKSISETGKGTKECTRYSAREPRALLQCRPKIWRNLGSGRTGRGSFVKDLAVMENLGNGPVELMTDRLWPPAEEGRFKGLAESNGERVFLEKKALHRKDAKLFSARAAWRKRFRLRRE